MQNHFAGGNAHEPGNPGGHRAGALLPQRNTNVAAAFPCDGMNAAKSRWKNISVPVKRWRSIPDAVLPYACVLPDNRLWLATGKTVG